jgi:hypothetical protein
VVVENALDEELCRQLVREFPPMETFTEGRAYPDNYKLIYPAAKALRNPDLFDPWKRFIQDHLQRDVWLDMVRLFRPYLLSAYPDFETRFGKIEQLRVGTRNIDDYSNCDVLLDSELVIHIPVADHPCVERGPHLKTRDKPFVAYLYLRPDEDHSQGADHALYSIKPGTSLRFDQVQATDPAFLNVEKVIPYRRNTFIFFLNTPESIQGLTVRSVAPLPLMMYHFLAQMSGPLFEIEFEPPLVRASFVRTLARRAGLRAVVHSIRKAAGRLKQQA